MGLPGIIEKSKKIFIAKKSPKHFQNISKTNLKNVLEIQKKKAIGLEIFLL